jgi:hypothetical protein
MPDVLRARPPYVRAHDIAHFHDERFRRLQRFNLVKREEALLARAIRRRGRSAFERCADLRCQRRDTAWRAACAARRERSARRLGWRRRIAIPATTSSWAAFEAGGKGAGSSLAIALGLVEASDEAGAGPQDTAHARRSPGRRALSVARGVERLRRPAQVARDQRIRPATTPSRATAFDRRRAPRAASLARG